MRGKKLELSAADDKAWPLESWAALLRHVHTTLPKAVIVLVRAPEESLLLNWIAANRRPRSGDSHMPLSDLVALWTIGQSMISVDTGPRTPPPPAHNRLDQISKKTVFEALRTSPGLGRVTMR